MLWLVLLTALASSSDGATTWWTLTKHPARVLETNPVVMSFYERAPRGVFIGGITLLGAGTSTLLGLIAGAFGAGAVAQVMFLVVIGAAAVNNALVLRRLDRERSSAD